MQPVFDYLEEPRSTSAFLQRRRLATPDGGSVPGEKQAQGPPPLQLQQHSGPRTWPDPKPTGQTQSPPGLCVQGSTTNSAKVRLLFQVEVLELSRSVETSDGSRGAGSSVLPPFA
ncbi:hypothetical protein N7462_009921 [Penicillium macrosclerotiorum]|uniref:uncharacterized protein n=1 Tax=Penicillium macrosclerotiorum TaxID=303699 RepID=UPI002549C018|nr:uncharacterized protein N7462_009921 [Penicillium macrosclerotiorum]KAJ5668851.1 hypothetical protein N7462_009921 [Penicillium macrosclerotiorum]